MKEERLTIQAVKELKRAFTHGGKFHSDDVFAAALLKYLNPDIIIERGFQIPEDYDGIVFDIGFGKYDHHQKDARVRENGIPYAAFGLLWEELGAEILGEEAAKDLDEKFIQPLDLSDNTGCDNQIAELISLYNPNWNESASTDERFMQAVELAKTILERKFLKIKSVQKACNLLEPEVRKAENGILILKHYVPWKKAVEGTEIVYVIYHSQRGGFAAQAVEDENGEMKSPFPEEWRGKSDQDLVEASKIEGLTFCHKSGFLIAGDTLDTIWKACKLACEKNKQRNQSK